ncbi:c-Myc-binding protein [Chionoecetes opilio]|uniref:c-Myc-binding protein n=1 Tax=Chionoecetes opilio TaxID=41210 RepID=A0A8J8WM47_CHIOP|nr:c-Myc-binding protein [Chionoecetes opilio]
MDSEREKFRTYIEKTGVMSALTDALVQLYEEQERPTDALGHIKKTLGSFTPSTQHCHMLEEKVKEQEAQMESQHTQINELMSEVNNLRDLVAHYEGQGETPRPSSEATRTS